MIKKILFDFLTTKTFGSLLYQFFIDKVPDIRWRGFNYDLKPLLQKPQLIASVFWGFYESAEKRMIERYYIGDLDVIELGASIGIVSSHIVRKMGDNKRLICVEANSALLETLFVNVDRHKKKRSTQFLIEHCAFSTKSAIDFYVLENTTSSNARYTENAKVIKVPGKTLSAIVSAWTGNDFFLVSDIEGAEAQLLWEDTSALNACKAMIIELHDTEYNGAKVRIDDMRKQLVDNLGFKEIDRDGNVFFFSK